MAAGPDLKPAAVDDVPSGNVDFAPTFLKLLGIRVAPSIQGRPLDEAPPQGAIPGNDFRMNDPAGVQHERRRLHGHRHLFDGRNGRRRVSGIRSGRRVP